MRLGASAAVPLLPGRPGTAEADRQSVLTAAARLWTEGHTPSPVALSALWTWGAGPRTAHETTAATPRLAVVTS